MEKEAIEAKLQEIIGYLEREQASIDSYFEKLLVAISNVSRLTSGEKVMLSTLQGTPDELYGYIIQLVSQTRKMASSSSESMRKNVQDILENLEE